VLAWYVTRDSVFRIGHPLGRAPSWVRAGCIEEIVFDVAAPVSAPRFVTTLADRGGSFRSGRVPGASPLSPSIRCPSQRSNSSKE